MKRVFFLLLALSFSQPAFGQYWGVWYKTHNITLGMSSDDKWAFFIKKNDAGIDNIYKVELKTNTVSPVTNFSERPVLSGAVLFGKSPAVVFSRATTAKGDDIHFYKLNVMTSDPPFDFTPGTAESKKTILGMAYNGRYIYYLADKGTGTKTDTYHYDCDQNITELAFANDKDYETIGWNRTQTNLLLHDPKSDQYYSYSIETTDRQKTTPDDKEFHGIAKTNISVGEKYTHYPFDKEKLVESATKTQVPLPDGAYDILVSPKETYVLYVNMDAGKEKLYLFDIAKKTSKELAVVK